jgi:hypothetical protein
VQLVEGLAQRGRGRLAGIGQFHRAAQPTKQRLTDEILQHPDLLGDGARRDVQFLGRAGKGEVTGGAVERAQRIEGRKTVLSHWFV